jgi:hypothetical protein
MPFFADPVFISGTKGWRKAPGMAVRSADLPAGEIEDAVFADRSTLACGGIWCSAVAT